MKTAFIIIDVQNVLVETGFQTKSLLGKISYLQNQARSKNIEIIYVQHIGIEKLVLCGMQTEYCVDTSVKVAFEYGY
ncbi:cysteine hydrolase family protein, partial [Streptococcus pneumoniae]